MDLNDYIFPCISVTHSHIIEERHTAPHVGSGLAPVLATPVLVNMFEAAALELVEESLPAGSQSLGTRLEINHSAATPIGMQVTIKALLREVNGRKLVFELSASDEVETIANGSHERIVVATEGFVQRVQAKADKTQ